jgi:protein TonB
VVKPKPDLKKKSEVHKPAPAPTPIIEPTPLPPVVHSTPAPVTAPSPPQKAAPAVPKPQPVKESFTQARADAGYGYNPKPKYPSVARSRGWTGKVILQVRVSAEGEAEQVTVAQSSGHEILDEAAINAVEGWRFTPAKRGDTPVASTVRVPMNFQLDN